MPGNVQILAPCGIDCTICPAYQATQESDYDELAKIVEIWASDDTHYEAEDLVCDGCYGERVSTDCRACWIKNCVEDKGLENCAHCKEYPYERLEHDWDTWHILSSVEAKARLDRIRENLRSNI
ncbi:MAG: DUF3795 domain-containing protein [Candidatus Bathyarchaeia archaeon]